MQSRRCFLRWFWGLAVAGVATLAYGAVIEPLLRLRITRRAVKLPGWGARKPLRIVVLADIHMGPPNMTPERLAGIVARANALEGDVIALLGDYVSTHSFVTERVPPERTAAVLAELKAPLGVWAVTGNHDWWDDAEAQRRRKGPTKWHRAFADAGIPVLENEARALDHEGGAVWLAGLGDQWAFRDTRTGVDDLTGTLAQIPEADDAPAILLAHEPDIFPVVPQRFGLTICGHTHAGQIAPFGWRPIVPSRYGARYAYGHIVERGRSLMVSAGLGCSVIPIRIGAVPEILVIEVG